MGVEGDVVVSGRVRKAGLREVGVLLGIGRG